MFWGAQAPGIVRPGQFRNNRPIEIHNAAAGFAQEMMMQAYIPIKMGGPSGHDQLDGQTAVRQHIQGAIDRITAKAGQIMANFIVKLISGGVPGPFQQPLINYKALAGGLKAASLADSFKMIIF